jgi:hypothetical protein
VVGSSPRRPAFYLRSGHMGFVVDKVALGQIFPKYFSLPCQFLFHRLLHAHHLSSGPGTIRQIVADVPSGLSVTSHHKIKKVLKMLGLNSFRRRVMLEVVIVNSSVISTCVFVGYFKKTFNDASIRRWLTGWLMKWKDLEGSESCPNRMAIPADSLWDSGKPWQLVSPPIY